MSSSANAHMPAQQSLRAARSSVLNTSELLELILLRLPARKIIAAQRVCKQWKECVGGSPEIKRRLFFTKETPEQLWHARVLDRYQVEWKRCLRDTPLSMPNTLYTDGVNRGGFDGNVSLRPARLSPLVHLTSHIRGLSANRLYTWSPETAVIGKSSLLDDVRSWASSFGASSFLTDPPCRAASVSCVWRAENKDHGPGVVGAIKGTIHRPVSVESGLTIRDAVRGIMNVRGTCVAYTLRRGSRMSKDVAFADFVRNLEVEGYGSFEVVGGIKLDLFSVAIVEEYQWERVRREDVRSVTNTS